MSRVFHRISRVTATAYLDLGGGSKSSGKETVHDVVRFGRETCVYVRVGTNVWGRRETFEESEANISKEKNESSCEPRDLDSSGNRSARNVFRSRNTVNDDL